jgi:hypothetical protein
MNPVKFDFHNLKQENDDVRISLHALGERLRPGFN